MGRAKYMHPEKRALKARQKWQASLRAVKHPLKGGLCKAHENEKEEEGGEGEGEGGRGES